MSVLLDTNVIVDHLRGDEDATAVIVNSLVDGPVCCSRLTMVELAVGMREHQGDRMRALERFLTIVDVDQEIGQRAVELARAWGASHGAIDVTDYVLAATSELRRLRLVTSNVGHFPMFDDLVPPY